MNPSYDVVTLTLNPALDWTVAIDDFNVGKVNRATGTCSHPGGKGINVAAALADYGHTVAASGFLGKENSTLFETLFRNKKIHDGFIRIEGSTRSSIKITDALHNETTDINFPGLTHSSAQLETLHDTLDSLKAPWFVLGGSLPPGVPDTFYRDLALVLKKRGIQVAIDTSGEALRHAVLAAPDLIKPNLFELETLTGLSLTDTASIVKAAWALLDKGIRQVVVSMGAQGACFVTRRRSLMAVPPPTRIRSSVGAGDAMVAGLISAQISGLLPEDRARMSTAFSLNALSHEGPGLTSAGAVRDYLSQISLKELNAP